MNMFVYFAVAFIIYSVVYILLTLYPEKIDYPWAVENSLGHTIERHIIAMILGVSWMVLILLSILFVVAIIPHVIAKNLKRKKVTHD